MQECLSFQLFLLEKDIVFQSISSAVFNELDTDSYSEHTKIVMFYGNFIPSSVSTNCVLVKVHQILKFGWIRLQIKSIKKMQDDVNYKDGHPFTNRVFCM